MDWGIRAVLEERGLSDATVAIELGRDTWLGIPYGDFVRLQADLPKVRFVESGPVIWGCRTIKSEWEIEAQRKACAIGGRAWKRCLEELHAGITSVEIQKRIVTYYMDEGADLGSGPPIALGATGPGGAFQDRRRALSRRGLRFRGLPDGFHAPGGVRRAERPPAPRA